MSRILKKNIGKNKTRKDQIKKKSAESLKISSKTKAFLRETFSKKGLSTMTSIIILLITFIVIIGIILSYHNSFVKEFFQAFFGS